MVEEEIKITGQVGGKVNDEELEIRFKTLLKQMKVARGLSTFSEQLRALLDEAEKSQLASEMSYGSQLTELNQLTARISEVFVGLAKQNETNRMYNQRLHDEEVQKKETTIQGLKEKEAKLAEELKMKSAELEELVQKHKTLEDDVSGLKARLDDQLKLIKTQDEQLNSKNETISNQAQKIDSMNRAISQNEELTLSVQHLKEDIVELQEKYETERKEKEFEFEKLLFAKEKELQQSFQERIEKIQDEMNGKFEERLARITQTHDDRVREVSNEMNKLRVENLQLNAKNEALEKENNELNTSYQSQIASLLEEIESLKQNND
jgi:F0F1-type ATP synthase membrane subunit b/b'